MAVWRAGISWHPLEAQFYSKFMVRVRFSCSTSCAENTFGKIVSCPILIPLFSVDGIVSIESLKRSRSCSLLVCDEASSYFFEPLDIIETNGICYVIPIWTFGVILSQIYTQCFEHSV
jgi:hypothetical protein